MRKTLIGSAVAIVALAATAGILYFSNSTPDVQPVSVAEAAVPTRPYVVKLHAQWCSVCLATKDEWELITRIYADRVNLVVFDFTDDAATASSRVEAQRLGLAAVLEQYEGATGMVLTVDPASRRILTEIAGDQTFETFRKAIETALGPQAG